MTFCGMVSTFSNSGLVETSQNPQQPDSEGKSFNQLIVFFAPGQIMAPEGINKSSFTVRPRHICDDTPSDPKLQLSNCSEIRSVSCCNTSAAPGESICMRWTAAAHSQRRRRRLDWPRSDPRRMILDAEENTDERDKRARGEDKNAPAAGVN